MIKEIRKEMVEKGSGGNKGGNSYGKGEDGKTKMEKLGEWEYGGNAEGDRGVNKGEGRGSLY